MNGRKTAWGNTFDITTMQPSIVVQQGRDLYNGKIKRVLDIGCGNFRNSAFFAEQGVKVDSVDIANTLNKLQVVGEHVRKNITFYNKNLIDFQPNGKYQILIATRLIQYLSRAELIHFIEMTHRVVENDGLLLLNYNRQGGIFEREDIEVPKHSYLLGEIKFMFQEHGWQPIWEAKGSPVSKHATLTGDIDSYDIIFQKIA